MYRSGTSLLTLTTFIESPRDRMYRSSLSNIIDESTRVAIVPPWEQVQVAAKRMEELRVNSVVIALAKKIQGILTSKDITLHVVAQNLSPQLTMVEKVMTPNTQCVTINTTILEALHIMHDGKVLLHLPVMDKDGSIVACVDVFQITHSAIFLVSAKVESSSFIFKFEDIAGRMCWYNYRSHNLNGLVSGVMERIGANNDQDHPCLLVLRLHWARVRVARAREGAARAREGAARAWEGAARAWERAARAWERAARARERAARARERADSSLRNGILSRVMALTSIGLLIFSPGLFSGLRTPKPIWGHKF